MTKNKKIVLTIIPVIGAILVALIQFKPWIIVDKKEKELLLMAGRVVDTENVPIHQAEITIAGRTEIYVTEDNGNFRIYQNNEISMKKRLRIQISKEGYFSIDRSVTPPVDNLIIIMRKK